MKSSTEKKLREAFNEGFEAVLRVNALTFETNVP